jgi:hypothetical protein
LFQKEGAEPYEKITTVIVSDVIEHGPETLTKDQTWTKAFWLGGGNVDVKLSKCFLLNEHFNKFD